MLIGYIVLAIILTYAACYIYAKTRDYWDNHK